MTVNSVSSHSHTSDSFRLIMETTEHLIQEKGCRSTTLQDIIERSGMSKGAIYHYVSGKDELFGLILKERAQDVNKQFYDLASRRDSTGVANPLRGIVDTMVESSEKSDVSTKILLYLLGQMENPKVASIVQETYGFILEVSQQWVVYGQQQGYIPLSIDANRMAEMFITFLYGLRVRNTIVADDSKIDVDDIFRMMLRSLQA